MSTDGNGAAVEVVILLASAGGLEALTVVLRDIPADFPAAVIVQQHLGGHTSVLPAILSRRTGHNVSWAEDGEPLKPHRITVCPPTVYMELKPDGTCSLRQVAHFKEQRFDVLLTSAAHSYGSRALAVVLSRSGWDGAAGTVAMKRAGGVVIAQSQETAQYPSMPLAAAHAGADCVLPLNDIGRVLGEVGHRGLSGSAGLAEVLKDLGIAYRPDPGLVEHGPDGASVPMVTLDNYPGDDAAARGEAARRRAAELQQRREELASGMLSTAQTVATARSRAQEAARRAETARQVAAQHLAAFNAAR
jgi:two-component system chemotaxis response regulator CheB